MIDTGIDYTHPDLAANVWSAPASFTVSIGGQPITCAARSFNAITKTCNPMDDQYHGTHVSGTIGGVGNNGVGVAGVNWITSLIAWTPATANQQYQVNVWARSAGNSADMYEAGVAKPFPIAASGAPLA